MGDYHSVFTMATLPPSETNCSQLYYRINSSRPEVFNIVQEAFSTLSEWEALPTGLGLKHSWNLLWTWSKPKVQANALLVWQRINHFSGGRVLTRKDLLKKAIERLQSIHPKLQLLFDIIPPTFILPTEYVPFVSAFTKRIHRLGETRNIWICKPIGLSRGRGITLCNDLGTLCYSEPIVVQEYIPTPFLLDGYKFDLRIYVLVTSFQPLEVFWYKEGFVRFCTQRYSLDEETLSDTLRHLTNSSIQKHHTGKIASDNPLRQAKEADVGGSKTTLRYLWERLSADGIDVVKIQDEIKSVILKTLIAVNDSMTYQSNAFEVYGFDLLLDDNCKMWLIEVNASPSMSREVSIDSIKEEMIHDTLALIAPLEYDRNVLVEILSYHLSHPSSSLCTQKDVCNRILTRLLYGKVPRRYGEMPRVVGNYERLAPHTKLYTALLKIKSQYLRS